MLPTDHAGFMQLQHASVHDDRINRGDTDMRALFVGGLVDNSELDLDGRVPPAHYPENGGGGRSRYRLHQVGRQDDAIAYAVYAAPDLADEEVQRVVDERDYARRFNATPSAVAVA
jgi:hypothetical protein